MNRVPHPLPAFAAGLLLAAAAAAQTPVEPPPWWRVNDNVTVSLYWDFNGPAPLQPTFAVVPAWYNPNVTVFVPSGNIVQVAGPTGAAIGLAAGAAAAASLDLTVDNDPYPDWIKIFWFQFDAFEGVGSSVAAEIEKSLNYQRATVTQTSVPLGLGWERVTVQAQLIPQPDDEGIDWSFLTNGQSAALIDNLFVNSKCVKPGPDETGDAAGAVVPGSLRNLTQLAPGFDCRAVARTEGPPPTFQRRYWVSTRAASAGALHQVLQLNAAGTVVNATALPVSSTAAPNGAMDLAVETVNIAPIGSVQFLYALVDARQTPGGNVELIAINASTGLLAPARNVTLVGFPAIPTAATNFGLAFDPSGNFGNGTFWVSDPSGNAHEFDRSGALLATVPLGPGASDVVGFGYDDTLGNFYGFSRAPQQTPTTAIAAHGFEWSGRDFQPTGNRFCGDLTLPNGAGPRGGLALGLEVCRSRSAPTSQLDLVCLVETPGNPLGQRWLYELAGPVSFGWSLLGHCHLRDTGPFHGLPFVGSTMEVALSGVPQTLFAALYLGFSNQTSPFGPLPLPLSTVLGWNESVLSVSPDANSPLLLPAAPGEFVLPIAIPPAAALAYTPVFCQWLALDSGVQGFFAMSQALKTVIYP